MNARVSDRLGRALIAGVSWLVALYLALPLVVVIAISFTTTEYLKFPPEGATLRWYWKVLSDPTFVDAFWVSSKLAATATAAALLLGIPAAMAFARKEFPGSRALNAAFLSPLVLPTIVLGAAILQYASAVGFARSFTALFVGHVVLVTPYVIRITLASLSGMELTLEEAAQDLGATKMETFFLVTMPQIKPGMIAGALFAFINSWINVEVSIFNSTSRVETIPVKLFNYIQFNIDPTLAAVSAITIYIAILAVVAIDLAIGIEKAAINTTTETTRL